MTEDPRLPPQNIDAERSLIGSVFFRADVVDEVAGVITADAFYAGGHREIWGRLVAMHAAGDPIDPVTVSEALESTGTLEDVGGYEAIETITRAVPHAAHADYYAGIVRENWLKRRALTAAETMIRRVHDDRRADAAAIVGACQG